MLHVSKRSFPLNGAFTALYTSERYFYASVILNRQQRWKHAFVNWVAGASSCLI